MASLITSIILTSIAVVTVVVAIPYFLIRRWKHEERLKQTMRDVPCVGGKFCKCYWCTIERLQDD